MINKLISTLAVSLLFAGAANAASLSIVGPDDVMAGDTFQLEIRGDFEADGGLREGGISFIYDGSLVRLEDIEINVPVTSNVSCPGGSVCPLPAPGSALILWANLETDVITPADGPNVLMATLTFTAIGSAAEAIALFSMADNSLMTPSGGWSTSDGPLSTPDFNDHSVAVNAVPLPAAVWFMIGGLGTLLGFRRK